MLPLVLPTITCRNWGESGECFLKACGRSQYLWSGKLRWCKQKWYIKYLGWILSQASTFLSHYDETKVSHGFYWRSNKWCFSLQCKPCEMAKVKKTTCGYKTICQCRTYDNCFPDKPEELACHSIKQVDSTDTFQCKDDGCTPCYTWKYVAQELSTNITVRHVS